MKFMALDVEPSYTHARSSREIEPNLFRNEGTILTIETLRIDEKSTNEAIPIGWKISKCADLSPCSDDRCWNAEKFAAIGNKCKIIGFEYPVDSRNYGLFEKETVPSSEKIVMESVSGGDSRDRACYIVKDISIDEGVQTDKRIMVESNGTTEVLINTSPLMENNDANKGRNINGLSMSVFDKDDLEKFSSRNPEKLGETLHVGDEIGSEISCSKVGFDDLHGFSNGLKQDLYQMTLDKKKLEETNSPAFAVSSPAEENCQRSNGVITFDFGSSPVTSSQSPWSEEHCRHDHGSEDMSDGSIASARSSAAHHLRVETASSIPMSLSESITSSGHILFAGSISHRSDSTTSTRSFAFPILQSEWNSSPVKMAKANRRHLRWRPCWRMGLFCCSS